MTEILHFEILGKNGQTHKQTDMGITIPRPPPMGARYGGELWGRGKNTAYLENNLINPVLLERYTKKWSKIQAKI